MSSTPQQTQYEIRIAEFQNGRPARLHNIQLTATPEASVSDLKRSLLEALQIEEQNASLLHLGVTEGLALPSEARVVDCQIFRGQKLCWVQGEIPDFWPVLDSADIFRLVHDSGTQLGLAWPVLARQRIKLRHKGDHLEPVVADEPAARMLTATCEGQEDWVTLNAHGDLAISVDGLPSTNQAQARPGSQVALIATNQPQILLRVQRREDHEAERNRLSRIRYRVRSGVGLPTVRQPVRIALKEPPPDPSTIKRDIGELILQQVSMLGLFLILVLRTQFAAWMLLYLLLPIGYFALRERQHRKRVEAAISARGEWARNTQSELGVLRAQAELESEALTKWHSSTTDLHKIANGRDDHLWVFRRDESVYLTLQVGTGLFVYQGDLTVPGSLTNAEQNQWRQHAASAMIVPGGPIIMDFRTSDFGIIGSRDLRMSVLQGVVGRLATLHSPSDVAMSAFLPQNEEGANLADWLSWLPHTKVSSPFAADTNRVLFSASAVNNSLKMAHEQLVSMAKKSQFASDLIVVVHEASGVDLALLEAFRSAADGHVHIIWIGSARSLLPALVRSWLALSEESCVFHTQSGRTDVEPERLDSSQIVDLCISLAPLIDEAAVQSAGSIPSYVPLSSLIDLTELAGSHKAIDDLQCAVGQNANGLQLVDLVSAGPHLAIAGTTGSGKSELLRTMSLSLAARYPPSELALILIDFKGGASMADLAALPHCVGNADNLEDGAAERLLLFLSAEIRRRQLKLQSSGGDYKSYRLARLRDPISMPRIVVIIDEFGALMSKSAERQSRTAGLVQVASQGRAFGIHLVLATQSPKNDVSEEIKVNVNGRIALRVLEERESNSMIGSPAAALLPKAAHGFTYARLDSGGDLVAFQSAFTKSYGWANGLASPPASIDAVDGRAIGRAISSNEATKTDAARLIERLVELHGTNKTDVGGASGIAARDQPYFRPWLTSFDTVPDWIETPPSLTPAWGPPILLGVRDDPSGQTQSIEMHDPSLGSILIYGAPRTGRTAVLRALAKQLIAHPGVVLLIVDWADGSLAQSVPENDRIRKFVNPPPSEMQLLLDQLQEEYADHETELSPLIVLVDRIESSRYSLGANAERLAEVISAGSRRRIVVIATADARTDLDEDLRKAFTARYSLMPDSSRVMLSSEGYAVKAGLNFQSERFKAASRARTFWARPLGRRPLSAISGGSIVATTDTGILVGVDQVRHEPVYVRHSPGVGFVGSPKSGRTTALLSACFRAAERLDCPIPIFAAEGMIPSCDWLVDIGQLLRSIGPASTMAYIDAVAKEVGRSGGFLAVDDIHLLPSYFRAWRLTDHASLLSQMKFGLHDRFNWSELRVFASGDYGLLGGSTNSRNGIFDQLELGYRNLVALQPVPGDLIAGMHNLIPTQKYLLEPRPGHRYPKGTGFALVGDRKYDLVLDVPDTVLGLTARMNRVEAPW